MPLYEMIILCKIGETQALANLIKNMVNAVYQEGGVVRKVASLGDRLSDKNYKAKDGSNNSIVRYISVHFDANPQSRIVAEKVARANSECLQLFVHKMKEMDYYKEMFDKDAWRATEVDTDQSEYKQEMIKVAAQAKIDMGENFNKDYEKLKNNLI
jgi:predicted SnoaL-like aldol condensation-catalyzing enzyme